MHTSPVAKKKGMQEKLHVMAIVEEFYTPDFTTRMTTRQETSDVQEKKGPEIFFQKCIP